MSNLKSGTISAKVIADPTKTRRRVHIETEAEGFGKIKVIAKKSCHPVLPKLNEEVVLSKIVNQGGELIAKSFRLNSSTKAHNEYKNILQLKFAVR